MQADPCLAQTSCEREPIHLSGAIQPHGVLVAASADDWRITAVSANTGDYCGAAAGDLLGLPLADVLTASSFADVARASRVSAEALPHILALNFAGRVALPWRAVVHPVAGGILLEAEQLPAGDERDAVGRFERFKGVCEQLMGAGGTTDVMLSLAEGIRALTGYGRAMIYRFADDWSGEVLAESRDAAMPSYLGLHFPASDIPAQARALYTRNVERQIPDVEYAPVPLLQTDEAPLDLSAVGLRSVSPSHVTYLKSMRVGASMSVSLLQNGRLWGLVACHHVRPHAVGPAVRRSCVLLAQIAMARVSVIGDAEVARSGAAVQSAVRRLMRDATQAGDGADLLHRDVLLRNSELLLGLPGASGMVLSHNGAVSSLGEVPGRDSLLGIIAWRAGSESEVLATDHLAGVLPAAAGLPEAAGLLSVPLGGAPENLVLWFRQEVARTVTWAGDPAIAAGALRAGGRLTPRRSFEAWKETVHGRSRPWTQADIAAANSLRDALVGIIVRRSADIQQLRQSNEELQSFAYVASHDLKEPLRQIEVFASLLHRAFGRTGESDEKISRWFTGISASSRRLRKLIDHLAGYARLGTDSKAFAPADLGELLASVLQDFADRIAEVGGVVEVTPLPMIMCDATQIRQVLQNLVSNAIKYRHPGRPLVLRIGATVRPVAGRMASALPGQDPESNPGADTGPGQVPAIVLRIADNGIGFDERHQELIFKPFERLHSAESYDGSGLGLAICRKVVDRHGGSITAVSRPGEGAVFSVTLPMRPLQHEEFRIA